VALHDCIKATTDYRPNILLILKKIDSKA